MANNKWQWFDDLTWPLQVLLLILCIPFVGFILIWAVFMSMVTKETITPTKKQSSGKQSSETHDHDHH